MNTSFADSLSMTVRSIPLADVDLVQAPANFLFIMPEEATQEDHSLIFTIANSMTGMGYVYIASADQTCTEDKGQIRYLPFRAGQLPSFGSINSVFVLRDRAVAAAALSEYRGAEGFLLEPRAEISEQNLSNRAAPVTTAQNPGAFIALPRSARSAA